MAQDDELKTYRQKRDFDRTPEPRGDAGGGGERPLFVVQKHDASRLHYDFRLEVDGVLKSWAVPKGPSADPSRRRLAVPTEDHPMGYADFEGTIPQDEYGGGTVMVWDTGRYRNLRAEKEDDGASMADAYRDGKLEVWLEGQKLRGGYALVRTGGGEDARWLVIKMKDDHARPGYDVAEQEPLSALTGRSLEEIGQEEGR